MQHHDIETPRNSCVRIRASFSSGKTPSAVPEIASSVSLQCPSSAHFMSERSGTNQTIFKSSNLNFWNNMLNRKVCRKSWKTCCLFLSTAARPVGPYSQDLWASQYPKRLGWGDVKECERNERNPDRRYPAHPSRVESQQQPDFWTNVSGVPARHHL